MLILVSAVGFLIGIGLLGLGLVGVVICAVLKIIIWTLELILWLLNRYAEPQMSGDISIVINIVDDDEDPPMRDVTPQKRKRLRDC